METRMFRVGRMRLWSFHLWLVFTVSSGHPVKAQPSGTDTKNRIYKAAVMSPRDTPSYGNGEIYKAAGQRAVKPPSTNRQVPVTYEASSDARNSTHAATSWDVSGRLSMVRAPAWGSSRKLFRLQPKHA